MRLKKDFIYTGSLDVEEAQLIEKLILLAEKTDKSEEETARLEEMVALLPAVPQERITVAQVNGISEARYESLRRSAIELFEQTTGITLPDKSLSRENSAILDTLYWSAAAIASTVKYEERTAKLVLIDGSIVPDAGGGWEIKPLPVEYSTVEGYADNTTATLSKQWIESAIAVNPGMWRQSLDEVAKNFDAVSANGSKKR